MHQFHLNYPKTFFRLQSHFVIIKMKNDSPISRLFKSNKSVFVVAATDTMF